MAWDPTSCGELEASTTSTHCAGQALSSGEHLLALVNDVLDIQKARASSFEFIPPARASSHRRPTPLGRVGQVEAGLIELQYVPTSVAEAVASAADGKGMAVRVEIGEGVPPIVLADPDRVRQVLLNLAGNAVKYSDKGTVTVRVSVERGEPDGSPHVRFAVTDEGAGIAEEAQRQLFSRFYRVRRGPGEGADPGGTGLGLAISKEICVRMGGRIGVSSAPQRGSTFFFTIPLVVGARAAHAAIDIYRALHRPLPLTDSLACISSIEGMLGVTGPSSASGSGGETRSNSLAATGPAPGAPSPHLHPRGRLPSIALSERRVSAISMAIEGPGAGATSTARGADVDGGAGVLPGAPADPRETEEDAGEEEEEEEEEAGPLSILVAEDNLVNARVVLGMLKREGHSVRVVHDGAQARSPPFELPSSAPALSLIFWPMGQALEAFAAEAGAAPPGHPVFDLVLMDCSMPVCDGYQATEGIRRLETARGLPRTLIAALTAHASTEDEALCLRAGMDLYLTKPLRKPLLEATVEEARERSAALRHAAAAAGRGQPRLSPAPASRARSPVPPPAPRSRAQSLVLAPGPSPGSTLRPDGHRRSHSGEEIAVGRGRAAPAPAAARRPPRLQAGDRDRDGPRHPNQPSEAVDIAIGVVA
eukprot:tig00000042_g15485.t1